MNKIAIVTGGTKGIGRATIRKFVDNGFDIITCSRNQHDLDELKEEIRKEFSGSNVHGFKANLSKKSEVQEFARFCLGERDFIDVLINNTGVFMPGQISDEADGNLEMMINTNVYSAYHLTRALLPSMMKVKKGYIFNICSVASIMPYANGGSYSISKYAMLGMTKVLREEMKAHDIRVTAILPGATLTASWEGVDLPESRFMKAEDVADAVYGAYGLSSNSVVEEIVIRPQKGDI